MRSTLVLLPLFAACVTTGDDAVDPASLVGTWNVQANAFDETPSIASYTFHDDGTYDAVVEGNSYDGTFVAEDGRLTVTQVDDDGTHETEAPFVVTAHWLVFPAFLPTTPVDGAIGTWSSTVRFDDAVVDETLTLDADWTGRFAVEGDTPFEGVVEGTWAESGHSIELWTDDDGPYMRVQISRLRDLALGALHDRAD